MRILQILIQKLLCLAVVAAGVVVVLWDRPEVADVVARVWNWYINIPAEQVLYVRYGIGAIAAIIGFVALLPLGAKKRGKSGAISYKGPHGPISIQLAPIEAALNKVISRFPEVKKINIKLHPDDRGRRVEIDAETSLVKGLSSGTTEMTDRLQAQIRSSAVHMLGKNEISNVSINVTSIDFEGDMDLFGTQNLAADVLEEPDTIEIADMTRAAGVAPVAEPFKIEEKRPLPGSPLPSAHDAPNTQEDIPDAPEADRDPIESAASYDFMDDESKDTTSGQQR